MTPLERLARTPIAALEFANTILTERDAPIGTTPKDVVWTHRNTTLYRYRSSGRRYPVPVLLVFALINRPDIFDLREGHSFVEFLLGEGYDVFLLDWGVPDESDSDLGLDFYVCDELPAGIRETLRCSAQDMYKENRLVRERMRLRGRRVDMRNVDQNVLVVTAGADHLAPREGTLPLLDLVGSEDVTHFDRPGGHIGLMAGSRARNEIWPDLAEWLGERSDR